MNRFLFVCTGNTCRSPMAEAIFRHLAKERGIEVEVISAGVAAAAGQRMANHSADVLKTLGIETEPFRSRMVTDELIAWADVILTMTTGHKSIVAEMFPSAIEKTYVLKEFAGGEAEETLFKEREALAAELQMKMSLNETISDEERDRFFELDRMLPDIDIPDPIGGDRNLYEQTAAEIKKAAAAIIDRLSS